jgi:transcription-repair coupling factor (superfamily II helicase)
MLEEAVKDAGTVAQDGGDPAQAGWEPVRLDVPVDAYIPADYVPYEVAKIDVHRRIAAAREPADLGALVEELEDRFGPLPDPVENLVRLQEARIKLGRAGARTVEFRQGRLVVHPIEIDSGQARALREEVEGAVYESLKRTLRVRLSEEGAADRFAAVVRVADALLRVKEHVPAAA